MANLLYQQIEMLSREKHIEPAVVVSAIEDAMVVAARKYYKTEEDLRAKFNAETGQVDVYTVHMVVEEVTDPKKEISLAEAKKKNPAAEVGTEIVAVKPTDVLGRIAAQTAKQVILQKVREAERDTIYNEYHTRVGELVTVIVKRAEGPDLIVDMGRTEARLPMREQSIIRELRGEKIDIIPYSEETVAFAQKALSPAKVTRVQIVDPESKKLEVIVEDSQLSLAIGKKGQNVRLASKLIGWDIDIKSEEEKRREIEEQMTALTAPTTPLTALAGVGPKTIEKIEAAGITSLEQLAGMTPEQLMEIPGIGEKMVDKIYQAVNQFYEGGGTAAAAEGSGETGEAVEGEVAAAAESEGDATETAEAQTSETAAAESAPAQTEEASANKEVQRELSPEAAGGPAVASELAPEASEAPDAKPVPEKHEEKSSE